MNGAVLDIDRRDEKVFPVASALGAPGIPFLFTTGYGVSDVPPACRHVARCEKPVDLRAVLRALSGG